MGSFYAKHVMFQLKNFKRVVMTLTGDVKFGGKLTRGLKNDKKIGYFSCE